VLADARIEDIPAFLGPTSTTHYRIAQLTPAHAEPLLRVLSSRPQLPEPDLGRPPAEPTGRGAADGANRTPVSRLALADLRGLVDRLLAVTELAAPAQWQQVLDLLPDHLRQAVPRHPASRAEAIALLRTCERYPGAWTALLDALRLISPGSAAVQQFAAEVDRLALETD
jgi:hypothetical protein